MGSPRNLIDRSSEVKQRKLQLEMQKEHKLRQDLEQKMNKIECVRSKGNSTIRNSDAKLKQATRRREESEQRK